MWPTDTRFNVLYSVTTKDTTFYRRRESEKLHQDHSYIVAHYDS